MIYKKKDSKYWYIKFELTFDGNTKKVHRSSKETIRAKAEQQEAKLRQLIWKQLTEEEEKPKRISEAVSLYLDSRRHTKTIKEKTNKLNWWIDKLGDPLLKQVKADKLLQILSTKANISIATRNRYLAEIKTFLNFCHQDLGWIDKVPVLKIYKESPRDFYKLDNLDIKQLIAASPDYIRPIIAFALLTGLRRSNILNLRWAQIDFKRQEIRIAATDHKSGKAVTTPLSDQAMALLHKLAQQRESSYVFINTRLNPVKDIKDKKWKEITEKAGLPGLRFHDLRHNWATRHVESGTDLLALKELGGWRTLEMVQRYAHPSQEYLSSQAKNIDAKSKEVSNEPFKSVARISERGNEEKSKKSSQLGGFCVRTEDYVIVGEPHKLKNLLKIKRLMVPEAGLEPARPQRQRILNPSCLPIPPLRQHVPQLVVELVELYEKNWLEQ